MGNTAQVTPTASYAPFVSLGTIPHEIRPRIAKALAFPGGQFGGMVFAEVVNHPGTAESLPAISSPGHKRTSLRDFPSNLDKLRGAIKRTRKNE